VACVRCDHDMPVCIALAGVPGAGKTTLALTLSEATGAPVLSRDSIKRAAFGPGFDVGTEQNEAAFEMVKRALEIFLTHGRSSIIDGCTFRSQPAMEEVEAVCRRSPTCRCVPVFLDCPPSVAAERLRTPESADGPADRTPSLVAAVHTSFRQIPLHWLRLDGTALPSANVASLLAAVPELARPRL